jgi:hypothetical protein
MVPVIKTGSLGLETPACTGDWSNGVLEGIAEIEGVGDIEELEVGII